MTAEVICDLCNKMFTGVVTPQETQSGCTDFAIKAQSANATVFFSQRKKCVYIQSNASCFKTLLFKGVKKNNNKSIFLKRLIWVFFLFNWRFHTNVLTQCFRKIWRTCFKFWLFYVFSDQTLNILCFGMTEWDVWRHHTGCWGFFLTTDQNYRTPNWRLQKINALWTFIWGWKTHLF